MVFYFMWTNKHPLHDQCENATDLIQEINRGGRPALPEAMSEALASLIRCMWNQQPSERPSSAVVMQGLLAARAEYEKAEEGGGWAVGTMSRMLGSFMNSGDRESSLVAPLLANSDSRSSTAQSSAWARSSMAISPPSPKSFGARQRSSLSYSITDKSA
jgi:hypothetical protein